MVALGEETTSCDVVLRELHSLKNAELQSTSRSDALILGKAYRTKIHELAGHLQRSVSFIEGLLRRNDLNLSVVKKEIKEQSKTRAEVVDKIFKQDESYNEIVRIAEDIAEGFLENPKSRFIHLLDFYRLYYYNKNEFLSFRALILLYSDPQRFINKVHRAKELDLSLDTHYMDFVKSDLNELRLYTDVYTFPVLAVVNNDFLSLKALIDGFGASPSKVLMDIARHGSDFSIATEIAEYLVKNATLDELEDKKSGDNILHLIAKRFTGLDSNHFGLVILCKELLKYNAADLLEDKDSFGCTPIFSAQSEILKLFIQYGANLDVQSPKGSLYSSANQDAFKILVPYFMAAKIIK